MEDWRNLCMHILARATQKFGRLENMVWTNTQQARAAPAKGCPQKIADFGDV
jgi:hypothetical protein